MLIIEPCKRDGMCRLRADVDDDLITEARHLILQAGALGQNFDVANLWQMVFESSEESGIEN